MDFPGENGHPHLKGFGANGRYFFWLKEGEPRPDAVHVGFAAQSQTITTIEGVAAGEGLHPMQQAFIERDGFQCGYCTPGQICSAVAMLAELDAGWPSAVTPDVGAGTAELDAAEIRERMSGNLCRCGAYPNIVAAIQDVAR